MIVTGHDMQATLTSNTSIRNVIIRRHSFVFIDHVVLATRVQAASTIVIVSEQNGIQHGCRENHQNWMLKAFDLSSVGVSASIHVYVDVAAC